MPLGRGDSGGQVRELQKALKEAGYDPGPIDGIFGPLTQRAVIAYQKDNDLDPDGYVSNEMLDAFGLNADDPANGGGGGDYTDASDTRFVGLPGHPELWYNKDTGESYIVYEIPGTEPPVPLIFTVSSEASLNSFFGGKTVTYDRRIADDNIARTGAIFFGSTDSLALTEGDPWAGFMERMERAMEVQPWLADPEVFALFAGAWLEGRELEEWELQTTDYWQSLNEAERAWLSLSHADPSQAEELIKQTFAQVGASFRDFGVEAPEELVDFITMQVVAGHWSTDYAADQMLNLVGRRNQGDYEFDVELRRFIRQNEIDIGTSMSGENQVQALYRQWLGPAFMPNDKQLARWTDAFRRDPELARDQLTTQLKNQRMSLFQNYTDPEATYEDIAGPWRSFYSQMWGSAPDETDPLFLRIVRMNDAAEAGKVLRQQGFTRGNKQITTQVANQLFRQIGGNVRRAI